ncbi:MAG: hypothetical protein J0L82_18165 [Deltaproteobacteria bacterium]|nr:hypothetical protein [Deltaproteobacteria bacterium]
MIKALMFVLVAIVYATAGNAVPAKPNAADAKVRKFVEQVLRAGPALNESELGAQNETHLVKTFKLVNINRTGDVIKAKVSLQINGVRVRDENTHGFSERLVRARWETIEFSWIR